MDAQTGEPIDYEDWGLCFEIFRLDPSGITINCSQPGVQQMRLLNAGVPILSRKDSDTLSLEQVQSLTEEGEVVPFTGNKQWTPSPDGFLTMEGTKELSFNFAQLYGQLPTKKALQNFDFGFQKSVSREKMLRLSNMTWVEQAYNICFLGGFCKRS